MLFFSSVDFFKLTFSKKNSGIPSMCPTAWIQFVGPDQGPLFTKIISRRQKTPLAGNELNAAS